MAPSQVGVFISEFKPAFCRFFFRFLFQLKLIGSCLGQLSEVACF